MPKPTRQETSLPAFPFVRQFTAPPFFVGLEDAKLQGELLVDAVKQAAHRVEKAAAKKKRSVKKRPVKQTAVKKKTGRKPPRRA